jgi:hypothetical protein
MRWLIAHVLPRMPLATSADAAADSFLFMALDPSLDGVGRKFFGEKHESSPVPSHTTCRTWPLTARRRLSSPMRSSGEPSGASMQTLHNI